MKHSKSILKQMRSVFESKYAEWRSQKKSHFILPNRDEYESRVNALKQAAKGESMTLKQRNWVTRYALAEDGALMRSNKKVLIQSELFDLLHDCHLSLGHGGRDGMYSKFAHYHGLSKEIIQLYINNCSHCKLKQLKCAKAKKEIVAKPILPAPEIGEVDDLNERCHVDFIDLQSRPDGDNKFIMIYQIHLTRFVLLRALTTKSPAEVSHYLVDIFATFGVPQILHSGDGRDFEHEVVQAVVAKWPECQVVYGKPRHAHLQAAVERTIQDICDILAIHLRENDATAWATALPLVQAKKNQRFHRGIKRSPFEALFGRKFPVGDVKATPPEDDTTEVSDEEQFVTIDGASWIANFLKSTSPSRQLISTEKIENEMGEMNNT